MHFLERFVFRILLRLYELGGIVWGLMLNTKKVYQREL